MPRRSSSSRKKGGKSGGGSKTMGREVVTELKDLLEYQRQQLRYGRPNVEDVLFPSIKPKKYSFSVSYPLTALNASSTLATVASYAFTLNALPNYVAFANLFDRYRILSVNLQFLPNAMNVAINGTVTTAIDYDDTSSPTAELTQRDTALTVPFGTYFERTLNPRAASALYGGSAFTSYGNVYGEWVDTASSGVQYYGLKAYVPIASANGNILNITAKLLIQFKNNF